MSRCVPTFLTAALVAILSSCSAERRYPPQSFCIHEMVDGFCKLYPVSMAALLANPQQFDGVKVATYGYMHLEFEGDALYFHQDDSKHRLTKNGLWVNLTSSTEVPAEDLKDCQSDQYLYVVGTFNSKFRGHMGLFSAELNIERCTKALETE